MNTELKRLVSTGEGKIASSWGEFILLASGFLGRSSSFPRCLFRGHSDNNWGLLPSFGRISAGQSIQWALNHEYEMQRLFRLEAHNFIEPPILPSHTKHIELWWSVMQHYGVATRLLDWSASPYVAAYFAVVTLSDCDGVIWISHPHSVQEQAKAVHGFDGSSFVDRFIDTNDCTLTWFFEPAVKTDRMLAQQGWFSVCANPLRDHAATIAELTGPGVETMQAIIIPSEAKPQTDKRVTAR